MSESIQFERIAIIGLGLIGGSIGGAVKAHGLARSVVGVATGDDAQVALQLGLIDETAASATQAVQGADLVIVATPVTIVPTIFREIAMALDTRVVLTDCASTKGSVIAAARETLGRSFDRYVPGHPIAGSELSGPTAARAQLFESKRWLFSPTTDAQHEHVGKLMAFASALGARPAILEADTHDKLFAEYSHAPHALVYALCLAVADGPYADQLADLAGAGFRDTSRIGASSAPLWTDILMDNSIATVESLTRVSQAIEHFTQVLASGDRQALEALVTRASQWRAQLESTDKHAKSGQRD